MTEPRQLIKIIEEITETKKEAERNLDTVTYAMRQSRAIMKEQAKLRLAELQKEFESVVMPNRLVGLFVEGEAQDVKRLAEFIDNKGGIVIDANLVYNKLSEGVEESYYKHREFSVTQFSLVVGKLRHLCIDLGYASIPEPIYKDAICPTPESTLQHVKGIIRECLGDDTNLSLVRKEILEIVRNKKLRAEQLVVLVFGANPQEKQKISTFFKRFVQFNIPSNYQPNQKEISALLKDKEETKE